MSLLNISRETSATNFYHQETDKIVEINILQNFDIIGPYISQILKWSQKFVRKKLFNIWKEIIKLATLVFNLIVLKNYGPSFEIALSGTCNLN